MWYLRGVDDSLFYFWEKQSYKVGRKNTDIIISDDESVSREHAVFEVDSNNVYLTDEKSTYGTYINQEKLEHKVKYKLKENDFIKFGLKKKTLSKFQLKKLDFTLTLSMVTLDDKKELQKAVDFLHATCVNAWSTSCTHLVVSDVILTPKVLCALTEEQPIVTVKYFQDYIKAIKANCAGPDVQDYIPEINEKLLSKKIKLEYNPSRRTLFRNKTFVFLTEKCKVQMTELISATGGTSISWEMQKVNIDQLKRDPLSYIFMEANIDDINENSEMYKSFSKCVKFLSENGKRSIPLQEIALAILHNSCEENCNPLFNRAALLIANTPSTQNTEQILAYDTEHVPATSTQIHNQMKDNDDSVVPTVVVMPSYDDNNISPIGKNSEEKNVPTTSTQENNEISDSEVRTVVVMPSYDDTDVSPIEKKYANGKRPHELCTSEKKNVPATSTQKNNDISDSEVRTEVVMPSYDGTYVSPIEKNSGNNERPLEVDNVEEKPQPSKKSKFKIKNLSKVFDDENTKDNSIKQDDDSHVSDSTVSDLFTFNRSSESSESTNSSKTNAFEFTKPTTTLKTTKPKPVVEETNEEENPFMRKRKAKKDISLVPKKIPLENISNKINPPINKQQQNTTNVTIKREQSTLISSNIWLSKTLPKKEIKDEEKKDVKIEDEIDVDEQFKNKIVIDFEPLIVKEEDISLDSTKKQSNSSQINFKKFRKNNVRNYQTVIIGDDQMTHFVVGETITHNVSDEEEEGPELEMFEEPAAVTLNSSTKQKRGRFKFAF